VEESYNALLQVMELQVCSLEIMRDERQVTPIDSLGKRLNTPDNLSTFGCLTGTLICQSPAQFLFGDRVVETELFTLTDILHRDKEQPTTNPDIRATGMVDMARRSLGINPHILTDTHHILILIRLLHSLLDNMTFLALKDEDYFTPPQVLCCKNTMALNFGLPNISS
jgi:hypothetical protein